MEGKIQNTEKNEEVTVAEEIRESINSEQLAEYIEIKKRLKSILEEVKVWSPDFDLWFDKEIEIISSVGKCLNAIGKWKNRKNSPLRRKEILRYKEDVKRITEKIGGWSKEFEDWIDNGNGEDIEEVGKLMDLVGNNVYISIKTYQFGKELEQEMRDKGEI